MSFDSPIARLSVASHTIDQPQGILIEPFGPTQATAPSTRWRLTTYLGLLLLVALWGGQLYATWGAWGDLTIDCGHEMYIPWLLAQGKMLYRDVWFMYGPAAPYLTSLLFRLFGVHLNVLYWAGSLSALGSAVFLYLAGNELASPLVGWTAGGVLLLEGFEPSLFCFPLPYSFSAVYACFVACIFIWLLIKASRSPRWGWMFAAGIAAALLLLLKPEFGIASYATLVPLLALRSFPRWSSRQLLTDVLAILPGVAISGLVIWWMISIGGAEFMTQENIVSWPTSYFMRTYGQMWLERNGFTISMPAFGDALGRTLPLAVAAAAIYGLLWWKRWDRRAILLRILFAMMVLLYFVRSVYFWFPVDLLLTSALNAIFFPRDMVLYISVATAIAWIYLWSRRRQDRGRAAAFILVLTFSTLLSFRTLMRMMPAEYPIYYNGPVVLCFLFLMFLILPRPHRHRWLGELAICLGCLAAVLIPTTRREAQAKNFVPLTTERGTVRVPKHLAEQYTAAIPWMKQKAALGQSVLSVPEDTSLYFLSGTYCPTRVFLFTPGVLAPGKMTDKTIREIDQKRVDYLLWSNRSFREFRVPTFGTDFDREVGDYLKAHYRPIGPLFPTSGPAEEWSAVVWERRREQGPN
jgi:hypothetical protein